MLVFHDGSIMGTIGGGKLESDIITEAKHVLASDIPRVVDIELTATQVEEDGMICGGIVKIFIDIFSSDNHQIKFVQKIVEAWRDSLCAVICTAMNLPANRHIVFCSNKKQFGTVASEAVQDKIAAHAVSCFEKGWLAVVSVPLSEDEAKEVGAHPQEELHVFFETILPVPTAYLFGGGHVSLHLAQLLPFIGFDFVVIDDRQEFANNTRFPDASSVIVDDCKDISGIVSGGDNSYFVIVTRGHKSDLLILRQLIDFPAKYVGMIGSSRKVNLFFQQLESEGVRRERLDAVHAPIGLPIHADTPEEIAVSIAAELIKTRRGA